MQLTRQYKGKEGGQVALGVLHVCVCVVAGLGSYSTLGRGQKPLLRSQKLSKSCLGRGKRFESGEPKMLQQQQCGTLIPVMSGRMES